MSEPRSTDRPSAPRRLIGGGLRRAAHPHGPAQLLSFALIGIACTAMYALLYAMLRRDLGPLTANVIALIPTMAVNFWANRSLTFRAAQGSLPRQAASYLVAYFIGLGASSGFFALLLAILKPHALTIETAVGIVAGLAATVVRYILMSRWVFVVPRDSHHPLERQAQHP